MTSSHHEWIIDSGATCNMSLVKVGLAKYSPMMTREALLGDDTSLPTICIGNLAIPNGVGGSYTPSVLHVLGLCYNLLSMHELCKLGLSFEFNERKFLLQEKHKKIPFGGCCVNWSLQDSSWDLYIYHILFFGSLLCLFWSS